ncbi:MAG: S9 family peptidase, partial [Planctomycetes bacterium]|nr:S9 family peptidase [Planctomycetota bacterium]
MQLSPDGKMIVYKLTEYYTSDGSSNSDLWLISSNGGEPERLTNNPAGAGSPQWSPDGKLVTFISNRDGSPQIWKIDINGGEASRLTTVSSGISGYRWSPDGQKIVFHSRVYPHCLTDSCNAAEDIKRHARKSSGMLFDKIPFRHYNRWDDGKVNHLFVY